VVLVDYARALFAPVGFEAERLAAAGASWEAHECRSADDVLAVARGADVVVVQSVRPLLTRQVLAQLPRCRCLIRAGAGYDSLDYVSATEMGIMVCNAPTYCTDEVADHAIALLLACARHIPRLDAAMRRGEHAYHLARPTRRLAGSTLGVIGLGRIGARLVQRMRGWEMRVLAYDPYTTPERAASAGAILVSLDELLAQSDFISLHCLLNEQTHHLLGREALARVKPGVILVNDSRGPLIDEEALVEALQDGRVWAAGLDVTEKEPLPADSPLLGLDNVILTPHTAAYSPQSREDLYAQICDICIDVVQGRIPQFLVNPTVLDHLRR
jgi:D-3-phosphoglycerate dehydrogenase